jgi:cytochrome c-type biogenesis protein CcmH/NrfG
MAHRQPKSRLFCPFREVPAPVLFLAMILLSFGSASLRGQTPLSTKEPGLATGGSASQAARPTLAKPAPARPGSSLPLRQSAVAYLRRGEFAAAIQAYKQALELDPNDHELKLGLARALSLSGRYEESKSLYGELLRKTPEDADALEGLGHTILRSDHPLEARSVFARLLAMHPANPEFQIDLARAETRLGHYRQARQILSSVLTLHPRSREARLQLANVKLFQGKNREALADFTQLLKVDPTDFDALLGNARVFYYRGDIAYSYTLVSKLVEDRPNDFDALFLLANLERARHHPRQALELLARLNQMSPGNPESSRLEKALRQEQEVTFQASASYARETSTGNGSPDLIGFSGQDLRRFGYESGVGFSALPRTKSSVSFAALPATSPGTIGGAVVPSEFMYRQTTAIYPGLTLRGGMGLVRFGPGGLQNIPGQSQVVSAAACRPLGFLGASYNVKANLTLDLSLAREDVPYTPLSVRMGVMDTRWDGGLRFSFTPRTELRLDYFLAHYSSIRFQQLGLLNGTPSLVEGAAVREQAHGGSLTLVRNILRFEHSSIDMGYEGRVFGFSGSQPNVYLGFFNPSFYQVHQLTARLFGVLRGPLRYDFSGGLGVQQVEEHEPLTQALNLNPGLSLKINSRTSLKLGYMHYNYAQSLGVIRGNAVTLSTDSNF